MNPKTIGRLQQIITKCNNGEKNLTSQETTVITLMAILNRSLINIEQLYISIEYINQLTERLQTINEAIENQNAFDDIDNVVEELDLLTSLYFKSKRTPGFQLNNQLKRALKRFASAMEKLGQKTEYLLQLYLCETNKHIFVHQRALNDFLSENNQNIYNIRGFSQIEIPFYLMQAWGVVPINRLRQTPRWEDYRQQFKPIVRPTQTAVRE